MPLRGESVGAAYVRIYADGSEVPDGIRDSLEDAEPSVREAGKKHGETYGEEFEKSYRGSYKKHFETTKGEMFGDLNKDLTDALAKLKLSDNFFKSKEWTTFLNRLENEFGLAGRFAGKKLEEQFRDSTDLGRLADEMRNIGPKVRAAQRELLTELHADALAMNADFDRRYRASLADQDKAYEVHIAHLARLDNERLEQQRRMLDEAVRMNKEFDQRQRTSLSRFTSTLKELTESLDRMEKGKPSAGRSRLRQTLDDLERLLPSLGASSREVLHFSESLVSLRKRLDDVHPRLSRFDHDVNKIGDGVGRFFGRGARNNFVNLFGIMVGMLAKSPLLLSAVAKAFINLGDSIRTGFTEELKNSGSTYRAFAAAVAAGVETIGAVIASGGAVLIGVGALLGLLAVAAGPVVSILSGLVGILTALAGTVLFGVVGAFAAWLPLILPVAAIIGGIVLAVKRFKDDAGPLADLFDKLKDRSKKWVDTFGDQAFKNIDRYGDRIDSAFRGLNPLFDAAGRGFDRFLDKVTAGLDSPEFDHFFDRFAQFLPHAMEDLGTIIANTFGGLGALLTDSIPLANRLLDWLVDITDQFDEWANSRTGRRQVKDWLDQAADSAAALGDFLGEVGDFLNNLLRQGQGTGDTIFSNMADDFQRWSKWLDDHPHAVDDWFGNAEDLSHKIGDLVDGLNDLIDTLDSATNRVRGNELISLIGALFSAFSTYIGGFNKSVDFAIGKLSYFGSWLGWFFSTLGSGLWWFFGGKWADSLVGGIAAGIDAASDWISDKVGGFLDGLSGMGGPGTGGIGLNLIDTAAITKAVTSAGESLGRLPGIAGRVADRVGGAFSGVPGDIRGFISGIPSMVSGLFGRLPQPVQTAVLRMIGFFGTLPGKLQALALSAVLSVTGVLAGLPGRISSIPGMIVGLFAGLGARILSAIGTIDLGSIVHLPDFPGVDEPWNANGAIYYGPTRIGVGEAGPEAIVPLNRPLSMVDPAVRALSAFAQGKGSYSNDSSRSVSADGWTIVSNSEDPRIVAQEMLDALVAKIN